MFKRKPVLPRPIRTNFPNKNHTYFISFSGIRTEYWEDEKIGRARPITKEIKSDGVYTMDKELKTVEAFTEIKKHLEKKLGIKNCVINFYKKLN
ncbi:MAG: hypothetical protein RBR97_17725 [Bacteroidales bacterium]|jgi:hypothetical protein|nr:hypothetical protein [Bacteroidales bacterium]